ncbi:uncharacterized protein LOC120711137 [Panicum virgatum]|uniref:uncharacterized protein LOC120711137 n=1 Tax=Panicum virgatum TaxID=38727 RepID=UPI0019D6A5D1|nr:uncharacterized protein LOC120711137 [Panicum virgatum]
MAGHHRAPPPPLLAVPLPFLGLQNEHSSLAASPFLALALPCSAPPSTAAPPQTVLGPPPSISLFVTPSSPWTTAGASRRDNASFEGTQEQTYEEENQQFGKEEENNEVEFYSDLEEF